MTRHYGLLFGPLAAALLAFGIVDFAATVQVYDHVRQTVSEIGEIGSPARVPFAILLSSVAFCLLVFAAGVHRASIEAGRSPPTSTFHVFPSQMASLLVCTSS